MAAKPQTKHSSPVAGGLGAAEGAFASLMALYYTTETRKFDLGDGFLAHPVTNSPIKYHIICIATRKSTTLRVFLLFSREIDPQFSCQPVGVRGLAGVLQMHPACHLTVLVQSYSNAPRY